MIYITSQAEQVSLRLSLRSLVDVYFIRNKHDFSEKIIVKPQHIISIFNKNDSHELLMNFCPNGLLILCEEEKLLGAELENL